MQRDILQNVNYVGREVESDDEIDIAVASGEAADAQLLNVSAKLAAHLEAFARDARL